MSLVEYETQFMTELENEWADCRGSFVNWAAFVNFKWMESGYAS